MKQLILIAAALVLLPSVAEARQGKRRDRDAMRAEVHERIRVQRTQLLVERLGLDEATTARVVTVLTEFDGKLGPLHVELRQSYLAVRRMVEENRVDPVELDRHVDKILSLRDRIHEVEKARFQALRKILSPEQVAILVVELPQIEGHIRKRMDKALRKHRGE